MLQSVSGAGLFLPPLPQMTLPPALGASMAMDTEEWNFVGRFWSKDHATKNITKVHFRTGAVTLGGSSVFRCGLHAVSSTASPMQPTGTVQQYCTMNAAAVPANSWVTATLNVARTINPGDLLAVVFRFQTYTAGDSVVFACVLPSAAAYLYNTTGGSTFDGNGFTAQTVTPNLLFECDDGTFATLEGAWPASNITSNSFNSGTAVADEYALAFSLPFPAKADGMWACPYIELNTSNFQVILYDSDGTTAMETVTVDANPIQSNASSRMLVIPFAAERQLNRNTVYRLSIRPTTTNSVTVYSTEVANAAHWTTHPGGAAFHLHTRLNQGATWTESPLRRPLMGIRLSALDDAATGGGVGPFGSIR